MWILRILYDLLKKDNPGSNHRKNIQALVTEMSKIRNGIALRTFYY